MEKKAILVHPVTDPITRGRYFVPTITYNTDYQAFAMRSAGFVFEKDFDIAPRGIITGRFDEECALGLARKTYDMLEKTKLNVVGISSYTSSQDISVRVAAMLKKRAIQEGVPLMIIGGGPFFVREELRQGRRKFPDSIEASLGLMVNNELTESVYDGIVYGGFQPFIDVMKGQVRDGKNALVPEKLPKGYYYLDLKKADVVGEGKAEMPFMRVAPFLVRQYKSGSYSAHVMFSNNCSNGCDFCSTGSRFRFDKGQLERGIDLTMRIRGKKTARKISHIRLLEPNPFSACNETRTREGMEIIYKQLGRKPSLDTYIDSALFVNPKRVLRLANEFDMCVMYTGRDAISEPGLSFIGTRANGRIKTQEMLDEEKIGMIDVINRLGRARRKTKIDFCISYIISPVETRESLCAMFDEAAAFKKMSNGQVNVDPSWRLLWPFPGTQVLRRNTRYLTPRHYFNKDVKEVWDWKKIKMDYPDSIIPRAVEQKIPLTDAQERDVFKMQRAVRRL